MSLCCYSSCNYSLGILWLSNFLEIVQSCHCGIGSGGIVDANKPGNRFRVIVRVDPEASHLSNEGNGLRH